MRTTKVLTLSLPPQMARQASRLAKKENLTQSELIRNALRSYMREQERWQIVRAWGRQTAKKLGIKTEDDVQRLVDEFRYGADKANASS